MIENGNDPEFDENSIEGMKEAREKAEKELSGEEKEARLREIDERIRDLEGDRRKLRDALEVRANSLTLPPEKDLDRILRYETANERQLNRALDRLERLQRLPGTFHRPEGRARTAGPGGRRGTTLYMDHPLFSDSVMLDVTHNGGYRKL